MNHKEFSELCSLLVLCNYKSHSEYDGLVTFTRQTSPFTNPLPERKSGRATKTIHHLKARLCF